MATWKRSSVWLLGGFWVAGIAFFTIEYLTHPPDPSLSGTAAYGYTYPGELVHILAISAAEILVAGAILRPWSYRRSWWRSLATAALFAPWLLLWGALGLHAGPTTHAHSLWLLLFWVGLVVATLVSGFTAFRAYVRSASAAP